LFFDYFAFRPHELSFEGFKGLGKSKIKNSTIEIGIFGTLKKLGLRKLETAWEIDPIFFPQTGAKLLKQIKRGKTTEADKTG